MFYVFNTGAYFIAVWLMVHLSASWTAGKEKFFVKLKSLKIRGSRSRGHVCGKFSKF